MSAISVIIPTYGRGTRVLATIERILQCEPAPCEVLLHVDQSDGMLEETVSSRFPGVTILSSLSRLGPGGGRHRCLLSCKSEFAAVFDDDSLPVDSNYFTRAEEVLRAHPEAAVIAATIWHRHQNEVPLSVHLSQRVDFTGCGHVIRVAAYRQVRGYLPIPIAYGMEESDLALQLFALGWKIYWSGELRVFHDTELRHHESPEVTAESIANVALFGFLHYPIRFWPRGLLQVANKICDCIQRGRTNGVISGLTKVARLCWFFKGYRAPLPADVVGEFLRSRRTH